MKTKTIVIGEIVANEPQTKIKFKKRLNVLHYTFETTDADPATYEYVELICRDYSTNIDLMFAYSAPSNRSAGYLYLGHWNSGVV